MAANYLDEHDLVLTITDLVEQHRTHQAVIHLRAAIQAEVDRALERAYLAARGTDKLDRLPKYQSYWHGRAEAAADVRALKSQGTESVPDGTGHSE